MMKRIRMALAMLLSSLVLMGCGGGGVSGPSEESLIGTWNATKIEYVGKAGEGTVDTVPLGWTGVLTLNADRTGTLLVTRTDLTTWSWAGPWEVDGDLFRLAGQGADITLSGGTLSLYGFDGAYDFNADGNAEPAKLNLVLTR